MLVSSYDGDSPYVTFCARARLSLVLLTLREDESSLVGYYGDDRDAACCCASHNRRCTRTEGGTLRSLQ